MITAYRNTAETLREQLRSAVIDVQALCQPVRACQVSRCRATCCHDGVYLSEEEKGGIESLLAGEPAFWEKYDIPVPPEVFYDASEGGRRPRWKTATRPAKAEELAVDYPAHFPQTRCIFLDSQGYCGLQRLSMEDGRQAWYDKPLTCWIHPLVILPKTTSRPTPVLTLVSPQNDPQKAEGYPGFSSCTHCGRPDEGGEAAYVALTRELEALSILSGRDLISEITGDKQD